MNFQSASAQDHSVMQLSLFLRHVQLAAKRIDRDGGFDSGRRWGDAGAAGELLLHRNLTHQRGQRREDPLQRLPLPNAECDSSVLQLSRQAAPLLERDRLHALRRTTEL